MDFFRVVGFSQVEILMLQGIIAGAIIAPATPRLIEMYKSIKRKRKRNDKVRRY